MAQSGPDNPDVYWDITVAAPFSDLNVLFLPGHKYRVRQPVYDAIKDKCDSAVIVPDHVQV